jgi:hypothetical protein
MKAWILDPLPFPRPDSLIDLRSLDTVTGSVRSLNPADFLDLTRGSVVRGPRAVPQRSNRPHRRRSGGACARGASDAEPLPTAGDTRGNRPRPWTGRWRVHEHSRGRPRTRVLARALQRRSGDGEPHRPHGRRGLHGRRLVLTPDDVGKKATDAPRRSWATAAGPPPVGASHNRLWSRLEGLCVGGSP